MCEAGSLFAKAAFSKGGQVEQLSISEEIIGRFVGYSSQMHFAHAISQGFGR